MSDSMDTGSTKARVNNLETSDFTINTPNCFLHTNYGLPPCITPDLLKDMPQPILLHVSVPQLYDNFEVFSKHFPSLFEYIGIKNKATGDWTGGQCYIGASLLDLLAPAFLPPSENEFSFDTPSGRKKITPRGFIEIIQKMKPNFIFAPFPELDAFSSKKRISKSVNNSNVFLKTVLEIIKKENLEIKNIWPVITGGSDRASRLASAGDFLLNFQNYPNYFKGVIFGGFNHGESSQDSFDLLKLCVDKVPESLLRLTTGFGHPLEILNAVDLGVDLFTSTYPFVVADAGHALTFNYKMSSSTKTPVSFHIRDKIYVSDWHSILSGFYGSADSTDELTCDCYCCKNHTRAYLHHLLATHELLANIFLNLHNAYHYLKFFEEMRAHIENNNFEKYKEWFTNMWTSSLASN